MYMITAGLHVHDDGSVYATFGLADTLGNEWRENVCSRGMWLPTGADAMGPLPEFLVALEDYLSQDECLLLGVSRLACRGNAEEDGTAGGEGCTDNEPPKGSDVSL